MKMLFILMAQLLRHETGYFERAGSGSTDLCSILGHGKLWMSRSSTVK